MLNSKRFCINCWEPTTFIYNRNVFHSECKECGFRNGLKIDVSEIRLAGIKEHLNKIIDYKDEPKRKNAISLLEKIKDMDYAEYILFINLYQKVIPRDKWKEDE